MTDTIRSFQIDAFTQEPFKGNPAAVCILDNELPAQTCQSISAEMNLSETAFVVPTGAGPKDAERFGLRWFTPMVEVPLCGHATLAAAWALFSEMGNVNDTIYFDTLSGELSARNSPEGILMDLPSNPPIPYDAPKGLMESIGIQDHLGTAFSPDARKLLIEIRDGKALRQLLPDYAKLTTVFPESDFIGIIVTSRDDEYDFISRFFAPWVGVNEDPVTGSAHTVLAPYWSKKLGKTRMCAYQASSRGGELLLDLAGDRLEITGSAVTVLRGELNIKGDPS